MGPVPLVFAEKGIKSRERVYFMFPCQTISGDFTSLASGGFMIESAHPAPEKMHCVAFTVVIYSRDHWINVCPAEICRFRTLGPNEP